jgi:hypothetical protein
MSFPVTKNVFVGIFGFLDVLIPGNLGNVGNLSANLLFVFVWGLGLAINGRSGSFSIS